jgi:pimeloyl-ACP methyl ester carboxylesterase
MDKTIRFLGKELHYQVIGQGAPVMLVHGFGEDGRIWEYVESRLSSQYTLIIPDLPGSGKSECLDANEAGDGVSSTPSLEDLSKALKAVLDAEGHSSCTMIGHSMGGYITLSFERLFPGVLNGLGLFHSTADPDTEEKKETRRKGIHFIREHGAALFLRQSIPNLFAGEFRQKHPEEVELLISRGNGFSGQALIQYYQAMIQRADHKGVLEGYPKPVLYIIGEEDKTVHLQDVLFQSHLPAISHVYIWEGVAHMGMRERPDGSVEALLKYLRHANGN